jgi:hypothetical protein
MSQDSPQSNKESILELFENTQEWKNEWIDMPEFIQEKSDKPYTQITIRFKNQNDLKEFSKLIEQNLTKKTKSIWFPQIERGLSADKLYVNES